MNETRVRLYEQLMEAEEQIAHARYEAGATDETVLAAMEAAEGEISEEERREDLFWSSLSVYVRALGGELELRAVFPEKSVPVSRARV